MPEPGEKSVVALVVAPPVAAEPSRRVGKRVTTARSAHGGGRPALIDHAMALGHLAAAFHFRLIVSARSGSTNCT
jgi:hypothetical protein